MVYARVRAGGVRAPRQPGQTLTPFNYSGGFAEYVYRTVREGAFRNVTMLHEFRGGVRYIPVSGGDERIPQRLCTLI